MKIRHEKWGEVDGVAPVTENWEPTPVAWFKDGADYPRKYGWSEVTEPRYVDVTKDCRVLPSERILYTNGGGDIIFPFGFRPIIKQWFDLPAYCENAGPQQFDDFGLWVKKFKKPCLTIEKEQS